MFKACLEAKYDDSYYFPTVFISYDIVDYEHDKNFYSTVFDEFNITEEEYNKLAEEWSYEDTLKFLSQIGYTVLTSENLDINGINVEIFRLTCDGKDAKFEDHLYISEDGEQYYFIDAFTQLTDPYPTAGYGIMKSIHKKQQ